MLQPGYSTSRCFLPKTFLPYLDQKATVRYRSKADLAQHVAKVLMWLIGSASYDTKWDAPADRVTATMADHEGVSSGYRLVQCSLLWGAGWCRVHQ